MKKATIILIGGLLLIALAGTAIAETNTPAPQVPVANGPNQDFYQEMYNYCYGQNGMMGQYYGNENNGTAPQGFGGMMGW